MRGARTVKGHRRRRPVGLVGGLEVFGRAPPPAQDWSANPRENRGDFRSNEAEAAQ
jgi:hypothetical protein